MLAANAWADDDPPARIARLAYVAGEVTFAPAGDDQWNQASVNRPLTTGDRLLTESNARAAMDIDGGDLRIGGDTGFNFLRLDDSGTQIELSRGTLNWRVDNIADGQSNEIDTPTIAFVASQPGTYKIEVSDDGSYTTISILQGAGTVYGEGGASYPISGRQAWRFGDSTLQDISGMPLARADDFDLWCNDRDVQARAVVQNDYVSPEMVGANDLAGNGDWDTVEEYGNVWYPRAVATGWAPYRYGHWAWVAPWGWTWIDDAPWGFAPFHYGRWVYVSNRWGWVPGPRHVRPVYCPAMVAFVGGNGWSASVSSGRPVAWVALGPRDVYVPWYRGSQRYVTNINVTNVRNIDRTRISTVYNDYRGNRGDRIRYMNQATPGGTTAISYDSFTRGHRVNGAQVNIGREQLDSARPLPLREVPAGRPTIGLQASGINRQPSQEFRRPPVLHGNPSPASTGARDNNRTPARSFGDGRDSPFNPEGARQPRDGNAINNDGGATRLPPGNRPDRGGDGAAGNAGASPSRPAQSEQDPRWSNRPQRENSPRDGSMPSSRFNPWRERNPLKANPPQYNAPAPQPSAPSQPIQIAPDRAQGQNNNLRWNNGARHSNGDDGSDGASPRGNPWRQRPQEQPQQQDPEQRPSSPFGNRRQQQDDSPKSPPQPRETPQQQAPREMEQRAAPPARPAPENRGDRPQFNRGEQHNRPPPPEPRQRPPG
ncbi:MAG: hypothetical protein E6Q40_11995 [Cupriavidus sp.]|nr:MAG: hypothetical protein E6Q40_11995 [Cupriavidus sp.]